VGKISSMSSSSSLKVMGSGSLTGGAGGGAAFFLAALGEGVALAALGEGVALAALGEGLGLGAGAGVDFLATACGVVAGPLVAAPPLFLGEMGVSSSSLTSV